MALAIVPASVLVLASSFLVAARFPLRGAIERLAAAMLLALAIATALLLLAGAALGNLKPGLVP